MMVDKKMKRAFTKPFNIYIDMDGVLARFEQEENALERFAHEKGFFKSLKATKGLEQLKKFTNENIFILTSSPNEQADKDKIEWVRKHLPNLQDRIITVRSGEAKAQYAKGNVLIDDYTDNLRHWVNNGGIAVKALNGLNGKTKRYRNYTKITLVVD